MKEEAERMSRKTIKQLYAEHEGKVSDKWSLYLKEYLKPIVIRKYVSLRLAYKMVVHSKYGLNILRKPRRLWDLISIQTVPVLAMTIPG